MKVVKYILKRMVINVFVLFLILAFLFALFRLLPGDVTSNLLYSGASPESVANFREKWRLDDPIYIQFLAYVANLLSGDAGVSLSYQVPVWEFVRMKIFNSFILVAPGITAGYVVGSLWGAFLGQSNKASLKGYGTFVAIVIGTIPIFFLAILAIIFIALNFDIIPSGGLLSSDVALKYQGEFWLNRYLTWDFFLHWILPFSVILVRYTYLPTLLMRTSVEEVKDQNFAFYQRITGLPRWRRLLHLGRHASLPVITFYPLSMTRAIGGLVLVELVFNWPGIGFALVQAVFLRDFPVVQFVFLLVAITILFGNLIVDIIYGIVDPRVSVGNKPST
jgi:peptide/nickel transport system permease protein